MQNPWAWLVDRFATKAVPIACATPHVWAAEQRQASEWALADKAQSYDGKFYRGDGAKGVMAAWQDGGRKMKRTITSLLMAVVPFGSFVDLTLTGYLMDKTA